MTAKKKYRPFAGVSHDVIDSAAFADLTGEAVRLLLIIARQHDGNNNGWLQASHSYCRYRGIASESTLRNAVASLIAHGFIHRTRSHGIDPVTSENTPARYALTWQSLTRNRKGLFCDGFAPNAFESWRLEKKSGVSKSKDAPVKKCSFSGVEGSELPPVKIEGSISGKASGETTKTVAIEQLPVYPPPGDGKEHDGTANGEPNNRPPKNLAHAEPMTITRAGSGMTVAALSQNNTTTKAN